MMPATPDLARLSLALKRFPSIVSSLPSSRRSGLPQNHLNRIIHLDITRAYDKHGMELPDSRILLLRIDSAGGRLIPAQSLGQ